MSEIQFSVLDQLDQLEEIVLEGSRIPFSGGRLVNEQDAVEIMDGVRASLPGQVAQADQLLQKKDEFITSARSQADEIVQKAQIQREQLVSAAAVRQEAERQVNEMRDQVRQQCEQLLCRALASRPLKWSTTCSPSRFSWSSNLLRVGNS